MKYYHCTKDLIMNNGIRAFTEGRNYGLEGEIKLGSLTIILNDLNQCHAMDEAGMTEHFEVKETETKNAPTGAEG
jgi:hypothetical protein